VKVVNFAAFVLFVVPDFLLRINEASPECLVNENATNRSASPTPAFLTSRSDRSVAMNPRNRGSSKDDDPNDAFRYLGSTIFNPNKQKVNEDRRAQGK